MHRLFTSLIPNLACQTFLPFSKSWISKTSHHLPHIWKDIKKKTYKTKCCHNAEQSQSHAHMTCTFVHVNMSMSYDIRLKHGSVYHMIQDRSKEILP